MTTHATPASTDVRATATRPRGAEVPEAALERAAPARWRPQVAVAVVVLGLVAGQAVAFAIVAAAGGKGASDEATAAGLVLADVIVLGIIVAFAARGAEKLTPATLGVRRTHFWPAVGWTATMWIAMSALSGLWLLIVGTPGGSEEGAVSGTFATLLLVLGVGITAPIVEELAFRGYLFPALTRWRGPWIAAGVTAVLFGAAHVAVHPVEVLPVLAVVGFVACLLFWFTGSLLPCVGLHALNNAIVIGGAGDWTWQVPLAVIGCVVLSVLILLPFARDRAPHQAA
jgi:membrane protease YdiL (CAAX protease family)